MTDHTSTSHVLRVAAGNFEIKPSADSEARGLVHNKVGLIASAIQSSVVLIEQGGTLFALLTSHYMTHQYRMTNILRKAVADALGISFDQTTAFSSHNHCTAKLVKIQYSFGLDEVEVFNDIDTLTEEGKKLVSESVRLAMELKSKLEPVSVRYGVGHERRISHNRKGRRADGSAYLMREEDRLLLGEDFNGDIDDDAFLVGFFNKTNKPVCFLTQFTAHPVTAYHCDNPVVHGEFPQVACDDLSAAFGGVPVAFLQGCAGDVNSKGLLAHTPAEVNMANAERFGHQLGETYIELARKLVDSKSSELRFDWSWVYLPYGELPSRFELEERLKKAVQFMADCDAGLDEPTRGCDGLNFPTNMTVPYRKALIKPIYDWLNWALDFYRNDNIQDAPVSRRFRCFTLRIGDVGIVGLPCEPLLGIGRQIKAKQPAPCTIPCGYMNDTSSAYVPDSPNCEDLDYVSAFYRYTTTMLPYQKPAGDRMAKATAASLKSLFP